MRRSGTLETVADLERGDHVCWAFHHPGEFRVAAAEFLAAGLAANERILYLGRDHEAALRADLAVIPGIEAAFNTGAARVAPVDMLYSDRDGSFDADRQVAVFAAEAEAALDDGYTALRVAADTTELAAGPDRSAYLRYEVLADRLIADSSLIGMCGFDRATIKDPQFTELAAMHPLAQPTATPFRLHAPGDSTFSAVLAGEIDVSTRDAFTAVLDRWTDLLPTIDGTVVIDARQLTFIDHHGLYALAVLYPRDGRSVTLLVEEASSAAKLTELLDLPGLAVRVL